MLSKNTVKFIKSLHQKKYRNASQRFFVEGEKSVLEVLNSNFLTETLFATSQFLDKHEQFLSKLDLEVQEVAQKQLESMGSYQSNDMALALVKMKENLPIKPKKNEWIIALDDVRDPGNLGTIIRIADWYGIRKLLFSSQTADFYNPKVIQASMGSFCRVDFSYGDLLSWLEEYEGPVYGAFMEGENVHGFQKIQPGVLVMGNESNGVSKIIENLVSQKLAIPSFGKAESLNVAIATAILCDNLKRMEDRK
ncbi:TrmH family RNA methyltransferase [Algoriphagus limi]|uniref:RNA methyltransferase n=1 Tax=Algoriphagus limi TaxID=2975273 RepID=A0ABT2G297_9BACT|nr:RNA methyltransferase [Algoriphagus limi]MCS5488933.1 RNA methyltransferase [Algoriphagus limi]